MAGTTTRKAFKDFMNAMKDEICIIPSATFVGLLQKNSERDERLCNVLERIANVLDTSNNNMLQHFSNMERKMDQLIIANDTNAMVSSIGEKLDKLTETISHSTKNLVGEDEKKKTNKNILKLKDLRNKYMRSEMMVDLSEQMLNDPTPYVQPKFRMKVNKNTPENLLECYRQEAIFRARTENEKMKVRMKNWEHDINLLKTEISDALSSPLMQPMKERLEQQMNRNEETNRNDRNISVQKIKNTYETETNSGANQFLLKLIDGATDEAGHDGRRNGRQSSKQFRAQRPYRKRRYSDDG